MQATPPATRLALSMTPEAFANLAFFEAYFSNFVEGTEFVVDEAAEIVFGNQIPTRTRYPGR